MPCSNHRLLIALLIFWLTPLTGSAQHLDSRLYDRYTWGLSYYYGVTCSDALVRIFKGDFHRWPEHLNSFTIEHTLARNNFFRELVFPLVEVVQLEADVSIRSSSKHNTIYEFSPFVAFRWANWYWNDYIVTSLAIGEGISYATSVPTLEKSDNENTKRLLNYLMLEGTFALPDNPRLQLLARIHHRSGAYGLYHAGNTGSNVLGLGLRFLFD